MFSWLQTNLPTLIVALVMVLLVAFVVAGLIRDKKKGMSSCGGCNGCSGCAGCSARGETDDYVQK